VKGKTIGSSQSSSSTPPGKKKTSSIECFKCGGHGHKQAACPNRRVILALADGSYDSQSEEEDGNADTDFHEGSVETLEYEAEDGECELGLNCLVLQAFPHVGEMHTNTIFPSSTTEITCADFNELLVDLDDWDTHDASKSASITLLGAPCHFDSSFKAGTLNPTKPKVMQEVICDTESGNELPLFPFENTLTCLLQPECLSPYSSMPNHSLVVCRVLSTQLVAAEQG
jgi:hypothetical protein